MTSFMELMLTSHTWRASTSFQDMNVTSVFCLFQSSLLEKGPPRTSMQRFQIEDDQVTGRSPSPKNYGPQIKPRAPSPVTPRSITPQPIRTPSPSLLIDRVRYFPNIYYILYFWYLWIIIFYLVCFTSCVNHYFTATCSFFFKDTEPWLLSGLKKDFFKHLTNMILECPV